jgi:hypothetical protein
MYVFLLVLIVWVELVVWLLSTWQIYNFVITNINTSFFFPPVALRPNAGHGLLILEVSRSHTTTHYNR